jgi:hypothetical protein
MRYDTARMPVAGIRPMTGNCPLNGRTSIPTQTAETRHTPHTWFRPLLRFCGWWFAMFALLGPLSTCPICGQPGCGGGAISAGILGGLAAAALWLPRRLIRAFRNRCGSKEHTR